MNSVRSNDSREVCFKDICLQVGVWGALIAGFLAVCVLVPMLALNI